MPAKRSPHIALIDFLAALINGLVGKGGYASASDLVRTARRVLRSRDEGIATIPPATSMLPSRSPRQA